MKVDFKVPATEKLMNEEIEKIKQNVLKNIKDLDIGLGVVSNTDDISIYKKNDQTSTTVQIILTTNKPVSDVTVATTDVDTVTKMDVEKEVIKHLPLDIENPFHVTDFELDTKLTTHKIIKDPATSSTVPSTTSLTTPNSTAPSTMTTMDPLPDHTRIDDLSFLSHLNKTVKDLIQDFHQDLGGTELPSMSSTEMPLLDTKGKSVFPEVNKDYFGATFDANDTFDFSGLQFLGSDAPEKEQSQNKSMPMYDNLSITKSPTVFDFSDLPLPSVVNDTEIKDTFPKHDVSNTDFSKTLDDLYRNFDFNAWKSDEPITTKSPLNESDIRNISDNIHQTLKKEMLSTIETNYTDEGRTQTTTNVPVSTTSSSLQDLYKDFLWNFGARMHTTPEPEYPIHDHSSHSSLHPDNHHDGYGLSYAPLHFSGNTIGPELTLTEESHFDFGGLSLQDVPMENTTLNPLTNETTEELNSTHNPSFIESEQSFTQNVSQNDLFHGTGIPNFDGLLLDSSGASEITTSSPVSSNTVSRDPKHESRLMTNQMFMTQNSLDLTITPTLHLSSSYVALHTPIISDDNSTKVSNGTQVNIVNDMISSIKSKTMMSSVNYVMSSSEENILPTGSLSFHQTKYLQTTNSSIYPWKSSVILESATPKYAIVQNMSKQSYTPQISIESSTTTIATAPTYSRKPSPVSSEIKISESSTDLPSSNKELIIDDVVFPKHLSFPDQKYVDHTLLQYPDKSIRSSIDGFSEMDFNENQQRNGEGMKNGATIPLTELSHSDSLDLETVNLSRLKSLSHSQRSSMRMAIPLDKSSIIPSLSSSHSTSSANIQYYDISKTFHISDIYDTSRNTELFTSVNLSSISRQLFENKQSSVQPSYHTRFPNIQHLPSSVLPPEMSSFIFEKYTSLYETPYIKSNLSILRNETTQHSVDITKSNAFSAYEMVTGNAKQQNTDSASMASVFAMDETSLLPVIPSSSIQQAGILTASEVFPDFMNITFPEQNWTMKIDISKSERIIETSTERLNIPMSSPVFGDFKTQFLPEPSSLVSSINSMKIPDLEDRSLYPTSSFQALEEQPNSEEIGVFQTNLPWGALDIIPTKSSFINTDLLTNAIQKIEPPTNIVSSSSDEIMFSESDNQSPILYPSTVMDIFETDTTSRAPYQTPSISVYHVTHEPIVYLTIDTRPVTESSMQIIPTSRQTLQATLFRDRRKFDDLSFKRERERFKMKDISDNFILSTVKTPTNVAITTSRPNLTAEQFADIRRRLAKLRAAKLEKLRRQQRLFSRTQSGIGNDFPLRREISGSNTANMFVGRGIDVNNRRSFQRPTRSPSFIGTTENPRQRVDRNRLFPGFNTDGQFNRNFLNNIRWNG